MKNTILLILLTISFALSSQTQEQRNKILKSYDIEKYQNFVQELKEGEKAKEIFLNEFLALHPEIQEEYFENGNHYVLYDIIDNKPIYLSSHNYKSGISTNTNSLYPNGSLGLDLEGENMVVGVWELDYPLETHVEFMNSDGSSRITIQDTAFPEVIDNHPSHVCGTVGASGVNTAAKGMAPKSSIVSYDTSGHKSETANEHLLSGMLISNHSYGIVVDSDLPNWYFGCYNVGNTFANSNDGAAAWDQIHRNAPYYLMVTSAGNDGNFTYTGGLGPGLDKLTFACNSKNNLVVANANINIQTTPFGTSVSSAQIASSSSQGPTDDGRIKPDITGRGTNVFSCDYDSNSSYATLTGTSMSSPGVAGSLLLLQEHYNNINEEFMKSATLRGLACHTATDDPDYEEIVPPVYLGPDPFWGWGILNAEFAAETITNTQLDLAIIEENSLEDGQSYSKTINVSDSEKLMATICWTDLPGDTQNGILNSTTPVLINDLDLRIFDSTGNEYFPWKLDLNNLPTATKGDNIVDNIERVEIELPSAGQYTITVTHKGSLITGFGPGGQVDIGPQDYSLIVTGGNMTLSSPNNEMLDLTVWPNPANDFINFQLPSVNSDKTFVSLIDIRGRKVYEKTFGGENIIRGKIETSNFANGIYILNIRQSNKILNKKVIIK